MRVLGKQALTALAMRGFQLGALFATTLILARVLGPVAFGAFAYATSWLSLLAGLTNMGFVHASVREVAQALALQRYEQARSHVRTAFAVGLASSVVVTLGILCAPGFFFAEEAGLAGAAVVGVALTPALVTLLVSQGVLRGQGASDRAQVPELVIWPGATLIGVLILLAAGHEWHSVSHVLAVYAGCLLLALVCALVLHWRALPSELRRGPGPVSLRWVSRAAPFVLVVASITAAAQFDVLVVASYLGAQSTGVYAFAARLASLPVVALVVIATPLGPGLAALFAKGERAQLQRVVDWASLAGTAGCMLLSAAVLLGAPWLTRMVNPSYAAGVEALSILCLGRVAESLFGPGGSVLAMTRHAWPAAWAVTIGACSSIGLSLLLIPKHGISGAAWAAAAGAVLRGALMWFMVRRLEGVRASALEALLSVSRRVPERPAKPPVAS